MLVLQRFQSDWMPLQWQYVPCAATSDLTARIRMLRSATSVKERFQRRSHNSKIPH